MPVSTRSRTTLAAPKTPTKRRAAPRPCPKETQSIVTSAQRTQQAESKVVLLEKEILHLKQARALNAQKKDRMAKNKARNAHRIGTLEREIRNQQRRLDVLTQKLLTAETEYVRRYAELDNKIRKIPKSRFSWIRTCIKVAGFLALAEFLRHQFFSLPPRRHAYYAYPERGLHSYTGRMEDYTDEELMRDPW